jgi:hypothetical protein
VAGVDEQLGPDAANDVDEAAANLARARFRNQGVARLEPDELLRPLLEPDEQLIALRRSAVLHHPETPDSIAARPAIVDVYVTSRRLVLAGPTIETFDLAALDEASVSNEHLLLVLCDGRGLELDVNWPRLLRVEIAAARAAQR